MNIWYLYNEDLITNFINYPCASPIAMFTGVIKLAQIDDYISPSQSCVQPKIMKADKIEEKATVTLNDCLACSGCITSAESVLIEQMSVEKFLEMGQRQEKIFIIISAQTLLSLAKYYKMGVSECLQKLENLFKRKLKNFEKIYDLTLATQICHQLIFQQFKERMDKKKLPVFCSECPGWVCYSEKTLTPEVIKYMSEVKSPQQILGQMIKKKYGHKTRVVSLMPCYDKKLQAIRFDINTTENEKEQEKVKEVDLTLATIEILQVIKQISPTQSLQVQVQQSQMEDETCPQISFVKDQTSNGYIEFILNRLGVTEYQRDEIKNSDFVQYTFDLNGIKSKMAKCYGFRNIQKVVQLIKKNKCPYLYVEIMACPGGCFGGGGQIRYQGVKTKDIILQFEQEVKKYKRVEGQNKIKLEQYEIEKISVLAQYRAVEKNLTMAAMNW